MLFRSLLTFRKPFPGETPDAIARRQIDRSEFVRPGMINPDVPPALEKIILRCLERDPDRRYPVTSVLAHEVRQALYVG